MSQPQVLVANSDGARRDALAGILVQCGLRPLIANNMREVCALLAQHPVDAVFCEDCLPQGGFRQVLELTKATRSRVPLVVCSRLGELDQYLEAMHLGAFDFIVAPFRRDEVVFIINALRRSHLPKGAGGSPSYPQGGAVVQDVRVVA